MKDYTKILEQLFDNGYATRKVTISEKMEAVVKSLSAEDQLKIEAEMSDSDIKKAPAAYIIHTYSLKLLSRTIVSYLSKTFETSDEAYNDLSKLSNAIVDKLVKEQNMLEKDIREALKLENVEANFSKTGLLPEKPEQPQEQTLESPAV